MLEADTGFPYLVTKILPDGKVDYRWREAVEGIARADLLCLEGEEAVYWDDGTEDDLRDLSKVLNKHYWNQKKLFSI